MNLGCLLFGFFLLPLLSYAQADAVSFLPDYTYHNSSTQLPGSAKRKLLQRNSGAILGLQRGAGTAIELGAEAHWRKLSLSNSRIVG
ncbi:MAG TPA: hypothetical protein VM935_10140, partial [Chitinophagaceae bacterium]|nr:hypothetical protein [Chitinophagaceae bacterium]